MFPVPSVPAPQPNNPSTDLANELGALGLPAGQDSQNYLFDMERAGQHPTTGIQIPAGSTPADFFSLLSSTETFAGQNGWKYFATPQQFNYMLAQGFTAADPEAIYRYLAGSSGLAAKAPWTSYGLTKQQYQDKVGGIQDTISAYTNDPNSFSDLAHQAMQNNWSSSRVEWELKNNPSYNSKLPWLKSGLTYNAFRDFKRSNQNLARQQFGAKATDQQFAQMYEKNAPQKSMSSTAATIAKPGSIVGAPTQSAVR